MVKTGARDNRLANAFEIENHPSIISPLKRDLNDLELLRTSNKFIPQWKPSPLAGRTDKSKARKTNPNPLNSMPQDEDIFDSVNIHIHSTPASRGSNINPRSGDSRRSGLSPNTLLRIPDDPVPDPRGRIRVERGSERIKISSPPAFRSHSSGESGDARSKEVFDLHIQEMLERGETSNSVVNTLNAFLTRSGR